MSKIWRAGELIEQKRWKILDREKKYDGKVQNKYNKRLIGEK